MDYFCVKLKFDSTKSPVPTQASPAVLMVKTEALSLIDSLDGGLLVSVVNLKRKQTITRLIHFQSPLVSKTFSRTSQYYPSGYFPPTGTMG